MSALSKTLPALAALGASALFLAAPQPAYASHSDSISCSAAGQTRFSPGVRMFRQSGYVSYRGRYSRCVDNSVLGISSARISATFHDVQLSCMARNFGTGSGTATIEWNADNFTTLSSKVDITIDEAVLNTADVSGIVTDGPFAGQTFTGVFDTSLLRGAGRCRAGALFGGVKNASFTGHFSIG